jgi:hypothetical protein
VSMTSIDTKRTTASEWVKVPSDDPACATQDPGVSRS